MAQHVACVQVAEGGQGRRGDVRDARDVRDVRDVRLALPTPAGARRVGDAFPSVLFHDGEAFSLTADFFYVNALQGWLGVYEEEARYAGAEVGMKKTTKTTKTTKKTKRQRPRTTRERTMVQASSKYGPVWERPSPPIPPPTPNNVVLPPPANPSLSLPLERENPPPTAPMGGGGGGDGGDGWSAFPADASTAPSPVTRADDWIPCYVSR